MRSIAGAGAAARQMMDVLLLNLLPPQVVDPGPDKALEVFPVLRTVKRMNINN